MVRRRESTYKKRGVFKLHESNTYVGDFIHIDDLVEILDAEESMQIAFRKDIEDIVDTKGYVEYAKVSGKWDYDYIEKYNPKYLLNLKSSKKLKKISLDEFVIRKLFLLAFPSIYIEPQALVTIRGKDCYVDFKLVLNGETKYLECDGLPHFCHIKSNNKIASPIIRLKQIEDKTGCEAISWPFWIQKSTNSAKAIFNKEAKSLGAIWGTNYLFGSFYFENSAHIIKDLTNRFNAIDNEGVGYFYEENSKGRIMPKHPKIQKILNGEEDYSILIPKGGEKEPEFWLPKELHHLIRK